MTRSHLVPPLVRWLRGEGHDVESLVARFALPADVEALDDAPIGVVAFGKLLEAAAELAGDRHLALRLPHLLQRRRYGYGELAAQACPTARAALERVARYATTFNEDLVFELRDDGREVVFTQRLRRAPRGAGRCADEYALASALTNTRLQAGDDISPRRVWFQHLAPRDVAPLVAFFGTASIAFGRAENGLAFATADLDRPARGADARLLATAEELAERAVREHPAPSRFRDAVARRVREALGNNAADAAAIAGRMRMSLRTLHRRLAEEDARFGDVVDEVRHAMALELLHAGSASLSEIALRIGLSDAAAFSRAFKRWTGVAPAAYRVAERRKP